MMNNPHKTLTLAVLAGFIFILGINVEFVGAQDAALGPQSSGYSDNIVLSRYLKFDRLAAMRIAPSKRSDQRTVDDPDRPVKRPGRAVGGAQQSL